MTYGCELQKGATLYNAMAMLTRIGPDCQVIAKTTERFKEKVVDNESVGTLHLPNPMLHSVLACSAQCVTASHSGITYSEVNTQLSGRGTDSIRVGEGFDV